MLIFGTASYIVFKEIVIVSKVLFVEALCGIVEVRSSFRVACHIHSAESTGAYRGPLLTVGLNKAVIFIESKSYFYSFELGELFQSAVSLHFVLIPDAAVFVQIEFLRIGTVAVVYCSVRADKRLFAYNVHGNFFRKFAVSFFVTVFVVDGRPVLRPLHVGGFGIFAGFVASADVRFVTADITALG